MTVIIQGTQLRTLHFGTRVDTGDITVPQNDDVSLFNVTGGRIIVTGIVGVVTTVIAGTTPSAKLVSTPTVGAAADITSATAITDDAVGNLYGVSAVGSGLVVLSSVTPVGQAQFVIPPGTIDLNVSAADATGAIQWTLFYVPLDGAAEAAAAG